MFITVAICTLNRAASLRRALESMAAMRLPDDLEWEIVIVNNNCTDDTDAVIGTFAERLPVRQAFEPKRGLSHARNRAIDTAKGKYLVWTDDDVVVDPGWLAAYADAFRHWPQAAVFSGPIIPRYAPPVPRWVEDGAPILAPTVFAACNLGDCVLPLSVAEGRVPYGPNFALRATEQREFSYDPDLGHAPGRWRRGEEVDVIERVLRSGATGFWLPAARLEHCSDAGQQTTRYVARYFTTAGETIAFRESDKAVLMWFGAPRWAWRQLIQGWIAYHLCRLIAPAPIWVKYLKDFSQARGVIRYWRRTRFYGSAGE